MHSLLLKSKTFLRKCSFFLGVLLLTIFVFTPIQAQAEFTLFNIGDITGNAIKALLGGLMSGILALAAFFTGFCGVVLNKTLEYTLINMSSNISSISGITIAWGVIRDLINMSFIFILLYIAIGTILGLSGVNWKKTLIQIVVAAILINFSLFFTKVIIDASNLVALTFYDQIIPAGSTTIQGFSDVFANSLKITTLYNTKTADVSWEQISSLGLMGTLFLLVTAFVFLAAALLFIARFITLVFVLILSPIGFFGSLLPGLGSYASKWKETLIGQALFAPIYMILTWVIVVIINDPTFVLGRQGDMANTLSGATNATGATFATGAWGIFVNFLIVIGFMIGTLIISKSTASRGSNLGQKLVGNMLGYGVGAAGWTGRKTLGRVGQSIADSESVKARASKGGAAGMVGRLQLKAGRGMAKGSYDFRESNFANMGKKLGVDGLELGLGGKAGGKGGYAQQIKDRAKKEKEYAESLKPSDIALDEAKQAVERAKNTEVSDERYKQEFVRRKNREREAERKAGLARAELREYEKQIRTKSLKADPELVARRRRKVEEADSELTNARTAARTPVSELKKTIKDASVKEAQNKLDQIQGVNEEEAKKRVRIEKGIKNDAQWKEYLESEEGKKEIKDRQIKSEGDKRKESYAETITPEGNWGLSTKRVLFVGKVKKEYKQAAADLRKNKKSVKDELEKILKDQGEIREKESDSSGAGEPKPETKKEGDGGPKT